MKKLPFAALLLLFCLPTIAGRIVTDTVKSKILSADVPCNVYLPDGFGKDKGQKYPKFAYNIQLGTDTKSKLICGVNAVQNPTDHYQIPALMNQILVNLQLKPPKN